MYYKEFREDNAMIDHPPVAKPCIGAQTWENNHGPLAGSTIEWDWLNFYWRVNNDGTSPISMDDFGNVYRQACSGNTSTNCPPDLSFALSYGQLNTAAATVLSPQQRSSFSSQGNPTG